MSILNDKEVCEISTHASDLAVFASDADTKIAAWNASAQRLLGCTTPRGAEAIGKQCDDVLQATLPGGEPLCHHDCDAVRCLRECRPYGTPGCRLRHWNGE